MLNLSKQRKIYIAHTKPWTVMELCNKISKRPIGNIIGKKAFFKVKLWLKHDNSVFYRFQKENLFFFKK